MIEVDSYTRVMYVDHIWICSVSRLHFYYFELWDDWWSCWVPWVSDSLTICFEFIILTQQVTNWSILLLLAVLFCSCTILRHDVLGQVCFFDKFYKHYKLLSQLLFLVIQCVILWMQETLLNLFLRNYLPYNLYDKAERLRSKAPRFEAHSNQQVYLLLFFHSIWLL